MTRSETRLTPGMPIDVQPKAVRMVCIAELLFGAVIALLFVHGGSPEGGLYLLPLIPIAIRGSMVRAYTDGDVLHVRNFWRTYRLRRDEIEGFEVVELARYRLNATVRVRRRHGRGRQLSAVGFWRRNSIFLVGRRGYAADAICARLNDWLRTGA